MAYISQYPPVQNSTYVKATSHISNNFWEYFATDPTKSLIGEPNGKEWISNLAIINQRFHIDLGSAKTIVRIYYENSHQEGTYIVNGVRHFTLWGSNDASAFSELTYGIDTGWTQLSTEVSEFDIHSALDAPDPKYILVTNTTAYRYYAFKFADNWTDGSAEYMAVRRIELQNNDATEIQKTILSDMRIKVLGIQKNILSDMKIVNEYQKTINSGMKINIPINKTITSDMHIKAIGTQKNILSSMSIAVLTNFYFVSNFVTKIAKNSVLQTVLDVILNRTNDKFNTNLTTKYRINQEINTNLATRLTSYTSILPKSIGDIVVYKDGTELLDVDYSTLKIQLNLNSTPSNVGFVLGRRHDDLDHTLLGGSSIITAKNKITVYDGTILLFTGYITKIQANSDSDTVTVSAEDKRYLLGETTINEMYYGGYNANQLLQVLEDKSGDTYSGDYSIGQLCSWLEPYIGTVYFNISDAISHVLSEAGLSGGVSINFVPEPSILTDNCAVALDTLINSCGNINWYLDENENFKLQYISTGAVKTLPLSGLTDKRGIYETVLNDISINKASQSYTPSLLVKFGKYFREWWTSYTYLGKNYYLGWNKITNEFSTDVAQEKITEDMNRIKNSISNQNEPQIFVREKGYYVGNSVNVGSYFIDTWHSWGGEPTVTAIYMVQYKSKDDFIETTPAVIGSGNPQKLLDLSQYGKKSSTSHLVVKDGWLGYQYDEEYDYTEFANDYANFVLSQNNKLLTEAQITLILDAYEYYGLKLSDLINLSNTTIANIYNNANGFPLNISGVTIDCATRIVTINATNYGKTFYKRSADYRDNYHAERFVKICREYTE